MKASRMIIGTLKEAPQEAVIDSHILLIRSGMVKKEVAGIYNYMPMGLKVLRKIENVIREEMDKSGAEEILCSAIQPKELWTESGRWQKYGPELMRLKDRNDREFCLGPTHEEVFTTLAKDYVRSYKDLPKNIYQIQTKYRDEMRPRFGLIRSREFIMKDAYSFDTDEEGLDIQYKTMYETYSNIFSRLHLNYVPVLADTGAIGGSVSHQFMALSDVGESTIIYNDNYAADQEKAESMPEVENSNEKLLKVEEVSTPNVKTIDDLSSFLNVSKKKIVKALIYKNFTDNSLVACFIRGDRELNKIKLANYLGVGEYDLDFALEDDFKKVNSVFGFVGPIGLNVRMIVDTEVPSIKNQIVGSNKMDAHLKNVNYERDYKGEVTDLRLAVEGDLDIIKGEPLKSRRGTEVGQIFKLGTKYSIPMGATYVNDKGQDVPIVMGCYGIGVSRTFQAIVEQFHDDKGITFPDELAPYKAVIIPVKYKDEMGAISDQLYNELKSKGVDVVLDDRNQSFGVKSHDWELIGIPYHIVVGRDAASGLVEFKVRSTLTSEVIDVKEAVSRLTK